MLLANTTVIEDALPDEDIAAILSLSLDWQHSGPGAVHSDLPREIHGHLTARVQKVLQQHLGVPVEGVYAHVKRFVTPCDVHCDGIGPDFTYLVALDVDEGRFDEVSTVVFEQRWPGGPAIFRASPPSVLDNAARSEPVAATRMPTEVLGARVSDIPPERFPHIEPEVLAWLSIDLDWTWRRGHLLVFPRNRLHTSGYFTVANKTLMQGGGRLPP
jgi:hypothetical protein